MVDRVSVIISVWLLNLVSLESLFVSLLNDVHASGPPHLRGGLGPEENVPNLLSNEKQFIDLLVLTGLF